MVSALEKNVYKITSTAECGTVFIVSSGGAVVFKPVSHDKMTDNIF